ncbi:MAG: hypothetical protein AUJ92_09515 [Armatimonadetes bacterium CG2_30_59_28]|nr:hypothetical protein [Armatimonadota bacterium]OIO94650.1 MAG: hypothetical protein AUJ92_09515 [Armatimonadetes bacterium CG2_30_59_28]PIU61803.1 MAG: hypothetical protein COS85_20245 [Armatimonadetes bacterium CG07_land_8_20_14_0_80_59_28]PIY44324.1 MAG: hypothetical protein COZ05_08460 [Armatimonadetes bacterium CG_4_10_14_3_um_filter_59_10]
MNQFLRKCRTDRISLIVSLPANSPELAIAAIAGGAECLKVHIRVHHDASGTHFGSLEDERGNLESILSVAGTVPVGIVAGAEDAATPEEMSSLAEMGFDFFDLYDYCMPAWMLNETSMTRVVAIGPEWNPDQLRSLQSMGGADILEAAIVPHDRYGEPLSVRDITQYRAISGFADAPVIVPTQKKVRPEEVPVLVDAGIRALMIGAIVTGKHPEGIENVTSHFRSQIDEVRSQFSNQEAIR